jgi:hypothetical protein
MAPQPAQPREVLTPKDLTQRRDGKQEARVAGPPLRAIGTQSTPGHKAMPVDMLGQGLAPGMEHGGDAEFGPLVFGVTGELLQGLSRGLEQQGVERPLVDPNEGIERMG